MFPLYAHQFRRMNDPPYPFRPLKIEAGSNAVKTSATVGTQTIRKRYKDNTVRKMPRLVYASSSSSIGRKFKYLKEEYEQELALTKTSSLLVNAGLLLPKPKPSPPITKQVDFLGRSTSKPFVDMPIQFPDPNSWRNLRAKRSNNNIIVIKPADHRRDLLPSASEIDEIDELWSNPNPSTSAE